MSCLAGLNLLLVDFIRVDALKEWGLVVMLESSNISWDMVFEINYGADWKP